MKNQQPKYRKIPIEKLNAFLDNPGRFSILILGDRGTGKKHWIREKNATNSAKKIISINALLRSYLFMW